MEGGRSCNMKVGIIIQARLGSTRLPNKVLLKLPVSSSTSVIEQIIERAYLVDNIDVIVIATTTNSKDDNLEIYLSENTKVNVFRGSEEDVLLRYYNAAILHNIDHVVRLTGDNPCIDPSVIEESIKSHIASDADYTHTVGLPIGMNVEIVKTDVLGDVLGKELLPSDREHVTLFVRNNADNYNVNIIQNEVQEGTDQLRLTLDTPEDYLQLRVLFEYFNDKTTSFGINDIYKLRQQTPSLFEINKKIIQKNPGLSEGEEILQAINILRMQELFHSAQILERYIDRKA